MKILLDTNNVAVFLGYDFEVYPTHTVISGIGVSNQYTLSNTSVIDAEVPTVLLDNVWKWESGSWVCVNQEALDTFILNKKIEFNSSQKKKREEAYKTEADPLFFMSQRGEVTKEEWLSKVEQIKSRFPYQE